MQDLIRTLVRRTPVWPIYGLGFLPAIYWIWLGVQNQLGPDPQATLESLLGEYALQMLILSLVITPLRDMLGVNLIKFRRAIGLLAFYLVILHLAVYLILDHQVHWIGWQVVISDVTKRPVIMLGVAGFIALLPLALSSNDPVLRRLGAVLWRRIHMLTYPAIFFAALHYVMIQKVWEIEALIYLLVVVVLILYRLRPQRR